jgi:hypothetical protein
MAGHVPHFTFAVRSGIVLATVPGYPAAARAWNRTKPEPVIISGSEPGTPPANPQDLPGLVGPAGSYLQVLKNSSSVFREWKALHIH